MGIIGAERNWLLKINLNSGEVLASKQLRFGTSTLNYIGQWALWDGKAVHSFTLETATPAAFVDHSVPRGSTFDIDSSETPGLNILGMCFDGVNYYWLSSTTVYVTEGPFTTSQIVNSWNHGVASARGIMWDGNRIWIMAA